MIVNKVFKALGEPTTVGDLDFMEEVRTNLTLFQHTRAEDIQRRMIRLFESNHRYEYSVRNDEGKLCALMVITCDDEEAHVGKPVLVPEMAYSMYEGLLTPAYRWMFELAKHHGIEWIKYTRTEGDKITCKYKQVKI